MVPGGALADACSRTSPSIGEAVAHLRGPGAAGRRERQAAWRRQRIDHRVGVAVSNGLDDPARVGRPAVPTTAHRARHDSKTRETTTRSRATAHELTTRRDRFADGTRDAHARRCRRARRWAGRPRAHPTGAARLPVDRATSPSIAAREADTSAAARPIGHPRLVAPFAVAVDPLEAVDRRIPVLPG